MIDHLVVLGGGFAGSLAAVACAGRARRITVVERHPPDGSGKARGLPQANHVHIFSQRGQARLETLVPGILDALRAHGASCADWADNTLWETKSGLYPRFVSGVRTLLFSRELLNKILWEHVRRLANVFVVHGSVRDVCLVAGRVRQVTLHDGTALRDADLYLDARGRTSSIKETLEAVLGPIPSRVIENALRYTTVVVDRDPAQPAAIKQYYCKAGPHASVGYYASEIEGGRMIFTAVDYFGTMQDPLAHLASHPVLAGRRLERRKSFAKLHNLHIQYGRAKGWIDNLAVIGDSVCQLNPVYGHGLTVATEQVDLLVRTLKSMQKGGTRRLQRAIDGTVAARWTAVAIDEMRAPRAPRGRHHAFCHLFLDLLGWASFRSQTVHRCTLKVLHGTAPPWALLLPGLWFHVALATIRATVNEARAIFRARVSSHV